MYGGAYILLGLCLTGRMSAIQRQILYIVQDLLRGFRAYPRIYSSGFSLMQTGLCNCSALLTEHMARFPPWRWLQCWDESQSIHTSGQAV